MLDHIPFHIQEEILERLPVKSLIKFRSVSKSWRTLIDSSHFIASHSSRSHTQPEHLLIVKYRDQNGYKNVSLVDDDAFPQQRFAQTIPFSVKRSLFPKIIGSSHGLSCVVVNDPEVVIWNPSIRKSITIWLPSIFDYKFPLLGFGVCPITLDPKIVGIRQCSLLCDTTNMSIMKHCEAMVYTLSSRKWREFSNDSLLRRAAGAMYPAGPQVIIDSSIYWLAYSTWDTYLILSFDITNETFQVIDLPHNLACNPPSKSLSLSKLRDESLIIFESSENQLVLDAWMMKPDDVERSFTKLYTIEAQHESVMEVVGFRRSGQPIMEVKHKDELSQLVVYDHSNLNCFRRLKINGAGHDFVVNSYEETLLLLGRSDCRSY